MKKASNEKDTDDEGASPRRGVEGRGTGEEGDAGGEGGGFLGAHVRTIDRRIGATFPSPRHHFVEGLPVIQRRNKPEGNITFMTPVSIDLSSTKLDALDTPGIRYRHTYFIRRMKRFRL